MQSRVCRPAEELQSSSMNLNSYPISNFSDISIGFGILIAGDMLGKQRPCPLHPAQTYEIGLVICVGMDTHSNELGNTYPLWLLEEFKGVESKT